MEGSQGWHLPGSVGRRRFRMLLRAEFVRRYDAQQVWVDGVDCCVVPPFQKTRKHDEEAPPPSRRTAAAVGGGTILVLLRSRSLLFVFSPNAVLYESCGMAPT